MSYSVDWIEPIYNREYPDVRRVMLNPLTENAKGAYNAEDLNRIENNTKYCAEYMYDIGIIIAPVNQSYKTDWKNTDIVTKGNMDRIISNIQQLMELSNPKIEKNLEVIQKATQMNYILANALEKNLDIMHTQPPYEPDEYLLTIENGIIYGQDNPGYVVEDDTVRIIAYPYGPSAEYMTFEHWTGNTDDLQYVGDVTKANTTYTMPDHDVTLTAEFKTNIPFRLTLTNATINDETGGTSRLVLAGTTIDVLADVAPVGKRFYCWEGTEEALELLQSGIYASTNTLTMPEKDVELYPKYINAGQHSVTITDTDGRTVISQEWYDYGDYVTISAPDKGDKWRFASWSGDTSILVDITAGNQSFNMKDENLRFTPAYSYVYGYNNVETNENCYANNEHHLEDVMESSNVVMTLSPEYQQFINNSESWFDCYSVYTVVYTQEEAEEGEEPPPLVPEKGEYLYSFGYDTPNASFSMPDYDVYIEPVDNTPMTLHVENMNNTGTTTDYQNLCGRYVELNTNYTVGQYVFIGWYRGDTRISDRTYLRYDFNLSQFQFSDEDTIKAKYEYRDYRTVTVENRNNAGGTETYQVLNGFELTINTTEVVGTKIVDTWEFDGEDYNSMKGKTEWRARVYSDFTIHINYRNLHNVVMTITNGTFEGGSTTYTGLERDQVTIIANNPQPKTEFDYWSGSTDAVYKFAWYRNSTTTVTLGGGVKETEEATVYTGTIIANFIPLYDLTVNTSDGVAVQGQYRSRTRMYLPASTLATSDTEWDKWVIASGAMSILNAFLMRSEAYTGDADTVVNATYKEIPYYTINIINGTFENGATSMRVMRNSDVLITMDPAPDGQAFLIWEVYSGSATLQQPRAEQTYIKNVTADATVWATFYTPDDETKYSLSITNKNGATTITTHSIGDQVDIFADAPDDGYEFYRWSGDTNYVEDRYNPNTNVLIAGKNVQLYMTYRRSGYTTLYDVVLNGGKMLTGMSGETEIWESDYQFEEGAVVQIKADPVPDGRRFNCWRNTVDGGLSMSTVSDITLPRTSLTVRNFDIELARDTVGVDNQVLNIIDGERSGEYKPNDPAPIYFSLEDNEEGTIRYTFLEWTGDINLELYTGGNFDIYDDGGRGDTPQTIRMPNRDVDLTATYITEYKATLINGKFEDNSTVKWLEEGDEVTITANTIEGKTFSYWQCSVNGVVDKMYNPTTKITILNRPVVVTAVYTNTNEANGIGYVLTSLYDSDIINVENVNIISGEIDVGFLISDTTGHLYVVTNYSNSTANILRLTQRWEVE